MLPPTARACARPPPPPPPPHRRRGRRGPRGLGFIDARGVRAAAASAAGSREEARPCGVAPARGAPKRWRPDGWCSTTVPPLPAAAAAAGEDDRSARPLRIMPPMPLMARFSAPRTPPPPPLGLTVEAAALTPDPVGLVGSDSRARSVSRPRALSSAPSGTGTWAAIVTVKAPSWRTGGRRLARPLHCSQAEATREAAAEGARPRQDPSRGASKPAQRGRQPRPLCGGGPEAAARCFGSR